MSSITTAAPAPGDEPDEGGLVPGYSFTKRLELLRLERRARRYRFDYRIERALTEFKARARSGESEASLEAGAWEWAHSADGGDVEEARCWERVLVEEDGPALVRRRKDVERQVARFRSPKIRVNGNEDAKPRKSFFAHTKGVATVLAYIALAGMGYVASVVFLSERSGQEEGVNYLISGLTLAGPWSFSYFVTNLRGEDKKHARSAIYLLGGVAAILWVGTYVMTFAGTPKEVVKASTRLYTLLTLLGEMLCATAALCFLEQHHEKHLAEVSCPDHKAARKSMALLERDERLHRQAMGALRAMIRRQEARMDTFVGRLMAAARPIVADRERLLEAYGLRLPPPQVEPPDDSKRIDVKEREKRFAENKNGKTDAEQPDLEASGEDNVDGSELDQGETDR